MKASCFDLQGNKAKTVELPEQFTEEFRPDLIMRAFLASQSASRQPYGAYIKAGQRSSAELSRRRRDFKTAYGHGISRVPRKTIWRRGTQFGWVGAFAPMTVGGRRSHPPKAYKILEKGINKKEKKKALRSALAATTMPEIVKQRGHLFAELSVVLDSKIEAIAKTKEIEHIFMKLKLDHELARVAERKVRHGRGKMRGRKYKTKTGPLIVVGDTCPLLKAAQNIPGVDVATVKGLRIYLLAPGGVPGRLTLYSEQALDKLHKEGLFLDRGKPANVVVEELKAPQKVTKKT